jgi:hypothetical protein
VPKLDELRDRMGLQLEAFSFSLPFSFSFSFSSQDTNKYLEAQFTPYKRSVLKKCK